MVKGITFTRAICNVAEFDRLYELLGAIGWEPNLGDLSAKDMRFAIVAARWNAIITDRLLQGSLDALFRSGASHEDVEIVRVPGACEIPSASRKLAESGKFDAIITLGALLRGETADYEAIYELTTYF